MEDKVKKTMLFEKELHDKIMKLAEQNDRDFTNSEITCKYLTATSPMCQLFLIQKFHISPNSIINKT